MNASELSPADLGLLLAQLMETDPNHELVLAARLALEIGDARRAERGATRKAGLDIHSAHDPAQWRRWAEQYVPFDELQRRRAVRPAGDSRPDYPGRGAA